MCSNVSFALKIRANLPAMGTAAMADGEKSVASTIWVGAFIWKGTVNLSYKALCRAVIGIT
jgi:hypothetical protein